MGRYVINATYTPLHWERLIIHPKARVNGFRQLVGKMGATMESFDYVLGEYDVLAIISTPDAVTQVAVSAALASSNVFSTVHTRELMDPDVVSAGLTAVGEARAAANDQEIGPVRAAEAKGQL